jgi:cbb3-type cytochrome oxidase cytochrome c subunit
VRGELPQGSRHSLFMRFDFSRILRCLHPHFAILLLFGSALFVYGAGFGQEKPADTTSRQQDTNQVWVPQVNAAEHCATCHQRVAQSSPAQSSVSQPGLADPAIPHHAKDWGCTVCHRGQGAASEKEEAHQAKSTPEQPILPAHYIQASCGVCHRGDLPEAPQLNQGRRLLGEFGCKGCHRLENVERSGTLGPDLTDIGTKVSREWIYKWLKEPRSVIDSSGNTVVNGYATQPHMPQFQLDEPELRSLTAFLGSLHSKSAEPYSFDSRAVATLENSSDSVEQGEARFRQMFCTTCHSLAVTRAGETVLIGGDIGPELTKVGSKVNPGWLLAWLRNPQAYLPKSQMPRYEWSDQDLYLVTRYINTKLTDPDLLNNVPKLPVPTPEEIRFGRRLFLKKGCGGCHVIQGVKPQEDFGPDLSSLGAESVSRLHFGNSKIPRTSIAYIQAKISDPKSVNPTAEMPQYRFGSADLDAITTALLSMTGTPSGAGMAGLSVPRAQSEFYPSGAFGKLYERYKCYVCHQFRGYGGTLAPALSFEGSRAQRQWMIDFLKNPQTLRPALTLRMPQFNMTDQEATILADYMSTVLQSPSVKPVNIDKEQFTPQMAEKGKQIYELTYQCQACHSIGASGGYVGPDLSNVGNWMTPAWMEAWLRDPQVLLPDSIEPRRSMTEEEVMALTAYLTTLRTGGSATRAPESKGGAQ